MILDPLDRYSRQIRFPQLGEAGQKALLRSRVTLSGCGALGTVLANHLARAGVGVIGSEGRTSAILAGQTPCLRCLIETAPPPGMTPTCETAGVLGPAVAVIASFEAIEAIKLLAGKHDVLNTHLIMVDVWDWTFR